MSESPHSDTDYRHDPHREHSNPPGKDPATSHDKTADGSESGTTPEPSPAEEASHEGEPDPRGERPVQPSVEPPD